jgi:hypothetical protein
MGAFSPDEAEKMRNVCFHVTVTANLLQKRFLAFGGIARWLFRSTIEKVNKDQKAALRLIQVEPSIIDMAEVAKEYKRLWSIYHLLSCKHSGGWTSCDDT